MRNIILALSLAVAAPLVHAGATPITHTFEPANPKTTDAVRLRTETQGCFSIYGNAVVLPKEPAIEVYFHGTDEACDPSLPENMLTPRYAIVGMLPAGHYTTRVISCSFGPNGTHCIVRQTGSLVVAERVGGSVPIPVMSWPALVLLSVAASLFALVAERHSRRVLAGTELAELPDGSGSHYASPGEVICI